MRAVDILCRFLCRFRHPVSLPEEVAAALGIHLSNFITFQDLLARLASPQCRPTSLKRFMTRQEAEAAFQNARRKEHFQRHALYSYYFSQGWVEFVLQFDDDQRLRRLYIQHRDIEHEQGIEISLSSSTERAC